MDLRVLTPLQRFKMLESPRPRSFASPALTWSEWRRKAKATARIDYGCEIKQGKCKRVRALGYVDNSWAKGQRLCCSNCAHSLGYLNAIPLGTAKVYAKLFDRVTGFWRRGGCVLPREARSYTCLSYNCSDLPVWSFLDRKITLIQITMGV